jgi:hypothetical protein
MEDLVTSSMLCEEVRRLSSHVARDGGYWSGHNGLRALGWC